MTNAKSLTSAIKLLGALVVVSVLFVSIPICLHLLGFYKVDFWDFVVMILPLFGILTTMAFNEMASEDFQYHAMGTQMCGMAFGACISILSIQLTTDKNMLPDITEDAEQSRLLILVLFLVNVLLLVITTRISKAVAAKEDQGRIGTALLKLLNFIIGVIMLGIYTLTLVVRG